MPMAAKRRKTSDVPAKESLEVVRTWYQHPWMQQVLQSDPALTSLELRNDHHISDEAAKDLAVALRTNTTLKRLEICCDGITDDTGVSLAGAIRVNSTLETLSLDTNGISNKTGIAMAQALHENVTMQSLTVISRHPERYFFGKEGHEMCSFVKSMQMTDDEESEDESPRQPKRRVQQKQWMTDRTAMAMVEAICVNNTLQRLELGVSSISNKVINAVVQALKENTTLQNVFINGRTMSSAGPGPTQAQRNAKARRMRTATLKKAFPGMTFSP